MSSPPVSGRRTSWPVRGLLLASLLIAAGYASAFGGAEWSRTGAWLLAAGNALLVPCAMLLGAPLRGRFGRLLMLVLAATGLVILASIGAALMPGTPESAASPLVLGIPRRAAIVLLGVGVLPMVVLPALFAWTFDGSPFGAERLAALRRLRPTDLPDDSLPPRPGAA
jgi:hypothetical protein